MVRLCALGLPAMYQLYPNFAVPVLILKAVPTTLVTYRSLTFGVLVRSISKEKTSGRAGGNLADTSPLRIYAGFVKIICSQLLLSCVMV